MDLGVIIAIVGALAWIPGVYGIVEAVRRHRDTAQRALDEGDRMVVQSALELLAPYKKRADELDNQLKEATVTIADLRFQLDAATSRASSLNDQLVDAQTELSYLRVQVKTMSQQLKNDK